MSTSLMFVVPFMTDTNFVKNFGTIAFTQNTIVGSKQSTSFEAHNKRFGPPEHTSKVKTMAAKAGTQLAWTRPPKQRDADSPFDFRTFWTFGGFFFGEAIE